MDKMQETADGRHAVELDHNSRFYGWVFYKHADGGWVAERRALPHEIEQARIAMNGQIDTNLVEPNRRH